MLPPRLCRSRPAWKSAGGSPGLSGDRKSTRLNLQSQSNLVCRLLLEKKKGAPSSPRACRGRNRGTNVGAKVRLLAMSFRAPALFAGERDLSERFLGPTENVVPRNDNCAVPECGLPCPGRTGQVGFACR